MENRQSIYAFFIYAIAACIGLILVVSATWADVESASYGFDRRASAPFNGLRCPILMTVSEGRAITVTVKNTTDKPLSPSVKTEISTSILPVETLESIRLSPGESKRLEWIVGADNIDLDSFIFFKVLVFASYPVPDRETTCGILILNLPLSGRVLTIVAILLSVLGMGYGLFTLKKSDPAVGPVARAARPFTFLTVVMVAGLFFSFMGWWIQNIVVLVFAALTIVVTINSLIFKAE